MPIDALYLIGSGGHCLVVLDSLAALGVAPQAVTILDQNQERVGLDVGGHRVAPLDLAALAGARVHVCIGDNRARAKISAMVMESGAQPHSVLDPRAIISTRATISAGSFAAPGSIVGSHAVIGYGCIINHGAVVDHECRLADFVHVAPGATLAGAVSIGREALVGAGANILPGICVAADCTIGAGAVLTRNAANPGVYVGVPARKI